MEASWSKSVFFFHRWLRNCVSRNTAKKLERRCGHCYRRACREADQGVEQCDICKLRDWLRNYHLDHSDAFNLFNEFLEMGEPTRTVSLQKVWLALVQMGQMGGSAVIVVQYESLYFTCTFNFTNPIIPFWLNNLLEQIYGKFWMQF